jgi:hypothetical protein
MAALVQPHRPSAHLGGRDPTAQGRFGLQVTTGATLEWSHKARPQKPPASDTYV